MMGPGSGGREHVLHRLGWPVVEVPTSVTDTGALSGGPPTQVRSLSHKSRGFWAISMALYLFIPSSLLLHSPASKWRIKPHHLRGIVLRSSRSDQSGTEVTIHLLLYIQDLLCFSLEGKRIFKSWQRNHFQNGHGSGQSSTEAPFAFHTLYIFLRSRVLLFYISPPPHQQRCFCPWLSTFPVTFSALFGFPGHLSSYFSSKATFK